MMVQGQIRGTAKRGQTHNERENGNTSGAEKVGDV
jgi:hypothetical protein